MDEDPLGHNFDEAGVPKSDDVQVPGVDLRANALSPVPELVRVKVKFVVLFNKAEKYRQSAEGLAELLDASKTKAALQVSILRGRLNSLDTQSKGVNGLQVLVEAKWDELCWVRNKPKYLADESVQVGAHSTLQAASEEGELDEKRPLHPLKVTWREQDRAHKVSTRVDKTLLAGRDEA